MKFCSKIVKHITPPPHIFRGNRGNQPWLFTQIKFCFFFLLLKTFKRTTKCDRRCLKVSFHQSKISRMSIFNSNRMKFYLYQTFGYKNNLVRLIKNFFTWRRGSKTKLWCSITYFGCGSIKQSYTCLFRKFHENCDMYLVNIFRHFIIFFQKFCEWDEWNISISKILGNGV